MSETRLLRAGRFAPGLTVADARSRAFKATKGAFRQDIADILKDAKLTLN